LARGSVRSTVDEFREAALRCPLPAAVELIGEKWAFLILRGAINGLHHFEEFQAGLGIARNILSDRLGKLVAGGIFHRTPDPTDKRKVVDKQHRRPVKRVCVLSEDGRKLTHEDLVWAERSEIESGAKGQAA